MRKLSVLLASFALLAGCGTPSAGPAPRTESVRLSASTTPAFGHVFVIVLENENAASTFSSSSPAIYLNRWLKPRAKYVPNYYGIGHHSLDNYVAMVSGQAPNTSTQADCPRFTAYSSSAMAAYGQVRGTGCVYPSNVPTVAAQLSSRGRTWRGYMDGMQTACQRPALGAVDTHQGETSATAYATKHNPFVYFRSIGAASCAANDVPIWKMKGQLASIATTPSLSFISPDLCHDGHDSPCGYNRGPGGLKSADAWLQATVPTILNSPAYKKDGLLIVTFDEAQSSDASACCAERPGPGAAHPGITGPGGGRVGALMLGPHMPVGTTTHAYNHYSLLATIEHVFGMPRLGYAQLAAAMA